MNTENDQLKLFKKKRLDAIYLIISGILFPIIGGVVYFLIGEVESGGLKQMSMHKIVYILYTGLGKNGTLGVFCVIGIVCLIFGIMRYSSLKKI